MSDQLPTYLFPATVLTVPGLDGSGLDHWQSRWERRLPTCERVQMGDWAYPQRAKWIERLDQAIQRSVQPVVLTAHSLGCLAVAWWAKERWSLAQQDRVVGALLVAPADVERPGAPDQIKGFYPIPREPLPFPSLLVASRNDQYVTFAAADRIAQMWGSQLVDTGYLGHINAESGLGEWSDGLRLLASLQLPESDPLSPRAEWVDPSDCSDPLPGQPVGKDAAVVREPEAVL